MPNQLPPILRKSAGENHGTDNLVRGIGNLPPHCHAGAGVKHADRDVRGHARLKNNGPATGLLGVEVGKNDPVCQPIRHLNCPLETKPVIRG